MDEQGPYDIDFLLVHAGEWDPAAFLAGALRDAAESGYTDFDEDRDFSDAVSVRYMHARGGHVLTGLTASVDGEEEDAREVVGEIAKTLRVEVEGDGQLVHALKFGDPLLQRALARYAGELFTLEMRLRETLSVVMLGTHDGESADLLREVKSNPSKDFKPANAQAALQNELFYLTFTDYKGLNTRGGKRDEHLERCLRTASSFEEAQRMIDQDPVHDELYQDFVASLRQLLDVVERTRNCVAHNRSVPRKTAESYPAAKNNLNQELDRFLGQLARPALGPDSADASEDRAGTPSTEL